MARVNTKQLIVDAAIVVAAQHGISGASMDQIAETAGVAKGSLYYNFASKDALFAEVMRGGFALLCAEIDATRISNPGAHATRAVAAATLDTLRNHVDLAKLMAAEVFRTDRAWASTMNEARASVVIRLRDTLRDAHLAKGGTVKGAERITETAGAAFFGALAGACLDWLLFRPELEIEHVLDEVLTSW